MAAPPSDSMAKPSSAHMSALRRPALHTHTFDWYSFVVAISTHHHWLALLMLLLRDFNLQDLLSNTPLKLSLMAKLVLPVAILHFCSRSAMLGLVQWTMIPLCFIFFFACSTPHCPHASSPWQAIIDLASASCCPSQYDALLTSLFS